MLRLVKTPIFNVHLHFIRWTGIFFQNIILKEQKMHKTNHFWRSEMSRWWSFVCLFWSEFSQTLQRLWLIATVSYIRQMLIIKMNTWQTHFSRIDNTMAHLNAWNSIWITNRWVLRWSKNVWWRLKRWLVRRKLSWKVWNYKY